ncbi:hypothetical protein [Kineosporia sp. A_224]|uniref:hypothetical protein n=1 Tax=Kineosporia sp. A_224 TaxID=1962180 RepID=UPI000B4BD875|nr:hypothetical protein [Kineosporia sp. A_224]
MSPDAAPRPVRVVLVGVVAPTRTALEIPVAALVARGAEVLALLHTLPEARVLTGLGLHGHRRLVLTRSSRPAAPTRSPVRRLLDAGTYRALRLLDLRSSAGVRAFRAARRDPQSRAVLRDADVLVALDRVAVYPVWRFARAGRRPAFYGIPAALRHLDAAAPARRHEARARRTTGREARQEVSG